MNRRAFITGTLALLATPLAGGAQSRAKTPRIGVLSAFHPSYGPGPSFGAFRQTLHDLGYTEGRNVVFEYRWADGRPDRLPDLAAELVRLRVDIVLSAWGTPSALAARGATTAIPVIFAGVGDAVGIGLVASLARPGGNVTGSTFITEETIGKQLELLKEIVPKISRVGVVINPTNPVYDPILKASEAPARALGVRITVVGVKSADDLETAVQDAVRDHVGGFVVLRDSVLVSNQSRLLRTLAKSGLPAMYGMREFADNGGLVSYGPNFVEMYRRAAYLVDKVLRGARPIDLPVEQAATFDFVINLKTAKALGLTIPPAVLARADEVIQ